MNEVVLLASGLGRAIDAAVVGGILMIGAASTVIWLLSCIGRSVGKRERIAIAAFWVVIVGLTVLIWEGGRMADERRHREAFPELYQETFPSK
jgi:hypothetical protein